MSVCGRAAGKRGKHAPVPIPPPNPRAAKGKKRKWKNTHALFSLSLTHSKPKERIDDTEDLVGIELDSRRNDLVALQLLVTLLTCALASEFIFCFVFVSLLLFALSSSRWKSFSLTPTPPTLHQTQHTHQHAVVSTVGALLGMNLAPLPIETTVAPFWWITGGAIAGGVALFLLTLAYARSRHILWIPKVPRD